MSGRTILDEACTPRLPRHAKLRFDKPRGCWIILAPERVFELDEIAHRVVSLCDGERTLGEIVDSLAAKFEGAPRRTIADDVTAMLQGLADKGFIVT